MAANVSRKSCVFSSIFGRLLCEIQPAFNCVSLRQRYPIQCRNLHSSEMMCGGKLKSEWRRKRAPALTRLCLDKPEKYKTRKAFGGGEKTKVTRAKEGSYIWKSQEIEFQTPILDVLYNMAHKDFTSRKIMVRGTVVEVDGEPFKTWYEKQDVHHESNDIKEGEKEPSVDNRILQQLQGGKVLAKVSSRPGQEGKVNGYLLEGQELSEYLELTRTNHNGKL
ncbi:40S ribosomal S8 [Paramuricea clavata]|nr:40S ribosomal S8 [Paramuricea clavata]